LWHIQPEVTAMQIQAEVTAMQIQPEVTAMQIQAYVTAIQDGMAWWFVDVSTRQFDARVLSWEHPRGKCRKRAV
jgi:hypothetical protein